jgi:chromosome partitioning protein
MRTVLVAGSKGGVGKTTVATHLAAYAALNGRNTALVDLDPQHSSMRWAQRRLQMTSPVLGIDGAGRRNWPDRLPVDTGYVVIDAPAGAMADGLVIALEQADVLVTPVPPSTLDIEATVTFLDSLAVHPRVRRGDLRVGLVGNKLKPWTQATQQTVELLQSWPYPLVAQLRDSQAYVLMSALGKSLFDYHSANVRDHQSDWQPLLDWIDR